MAFDITAHDQPIAQETLEKLFTEARTYNDFSDRPVSEDLIRKLYDLTKFGPTAANTTPARFVFVTSPEAKARLSKHMSEGNREKTLKAPVNLILGYDLDFHDHLGKLFPHAPDARNWYTDIEARKESAFRNSSLQGGYLTIAARALGLDVGPMSGFDAAGVKAEFFAEGNVVPNYILNIGYGTEKNLFGRLPRLDFDEAAQIL